MTKHERIAETDAFDLFPMMRVRPVLSPPRKGNDLADPELFAYYDPIAGRVVVADEGFTRFPAIIRNGNTVLIGRLGQALFVGEQLLAPSRRDRLTQVLQILHADDLLLGNHRHWVDHLGVRSGWQPVSPETVAALRAASAFGRAKAPPVAPMAREPELVA